MNGVEAMKYGGTPLPRGGTNRRPSRTRGATCARICRVSITDALAELVDVTEVADADGLSNVGAGGHSELHGLLDVVAIPVPLVQERSEGAVAGADGRNQLDVELTLGVPDVLAVGEVSVAAATTGEQHVLNASVVSHLHGNADLVVGVDRHAEDGLHLGMVRLAERRTGPGRRRRHEPERAP